MRRLGVAEGELAYAISRFRKSFRADRSILALLQQAQDAHVTALQQYDAWEYRPALSTAAQVLSLTDQALTLMGEPDRIFDPTTRTASVLRRIATALCKRGEICSLWTPAYVADPASAEIDDGVMTDLDMR